VDVFYGVGHAIAQVAITADLLAHGEFAAAMQAFKDADADVEAHTIATNARIEKIWEGAAARIQKAKSDATTGGTTGRSGAEQAVQDQMEFEKHFQERISAEQGFAARYAEAIKVSNVLAQEARKQGLLSEEGLIQQVAQNEDARLQVLVLSLRKEEELYRRKGELAQAQQAREKIALTEAQRAASEAIAQAQITSMQEVREQAFQRSLAQLVTQIQIENTTELDMLKGHLVEKQNILDLANEAKLITDDQYGALSAQIFAFYEKKKGQIHDDELKERFRIAKVYHELNLESSGAFFGTLGAMMASHNRAAFAIGKAAAISETIINTIAAAQGAFKSFAEIPYVGYAMGVAAAAAVTVAGMARVQQIRSTQFGGGGAVASPVFSASPTTGVPTAPVSPVSTPPGGSGSGQSPVEITVQITTNGNIIGQDGIRQLVDDEVIPALRDAIGNRDVVIIGPNSRQAANLVPT